MNKSRKITQKILEIRQAISLEQLRRQIVNWFKREARSNWEVKINYDFFRGQVDGMHRMFVLYFYDTTGKDDLREYGYIFNSQYFDRIVLKNSGWNVQELRFESYKGIDSCIVSVTKNTSGKYPKPRYLYHMSPPGNYKNIIRRGLLPQKGKTTGARIPDPRVYLFYNYEFIIGRKKYPLTFIQNDFDVFRVDTNKFDRFNLYSDDDAFHVPAAWTPSHIPAHALTYLGKIGDLMLKEI